MTTSTLLKEIFRAGSRKGWAGFVWMMKILVPISFGTLVLDHTGWLRHLDFLLSPAMGLLHLPPAGAIPLVAGMLTGIYGGIAAMTVIPFTVDQMTLMAVFLLISHNLVQEGVIQGKSGMNPWVATLFRITVSMMTVVLVARFLGTDTTAGPAAVSSLSAGVPFLHRIRDWGGDTIRLSLKILVIITSLMILLEGMKRLNLIEGLVRILFPFLKALGLDRRVGFLWLTAAVFGIAYGAAVIVEETRTGGFTRDELTRLHLSIGVNHSLVEDPILFLALGIPAFWLWIPRLFMAALLVHLFTWVARKIRTADPPFGEADSFTGTAGEAPSC